MTEETPEQKAAREAAGIPAPVAVPAGDYRARVLTPEQEAEERSKLEEGRYGLWGKDRLSKLADAAYADFANGTSATGKDPRAGQLVATRPDWYTNPAPRHQTALASGLSTGLDVLANGAQRNADLEAGIQGRFLSQKQQAQNSATGVGLLAGLGKAFLNRDQQDQAQDLDTAGKQANMYKLLSPSAASKASGSKLALEMIRTGTAVGGLNIRGTQAADVMHRGAVAQQHDADKDTAASPISAHATQTAVNTGMVTDPNQVGNITQKELDQQRTYLAQRQHEEEMRRQKLLSASVGSEEAAKQHNDAQAVELAKQERARAAEQLNATMEGGEWRGGDFVATPQQREAVQNSLGALGSSRQAILRLQQIASKWQDKFGGSGKIREYVAEKHGLNLDPEFAADIAEANALKEQLRGDASKRGDLGKPSAVELEMTKSLVDPNNTLSGVLFPQQFYKGLSSAIENQTREKNYANGFRMHGMPAFEQSAPSSPKLRSTAALEGRDYTEGLPPAPPRPFEVGHRPDFSSRPGVSAGDSLSVTPSVQSPEAEAAQRDARHGQPMPAKPRGTGAKKSVKIDYGDGEPPVVKDLDDAGIEKYLQAGAKVTEAR